MEIYKSLKILALPENEQEEYLIKLGVYPSIDELALQFDDNFQTYVGKYKEGKDANLNLLQDLRLIDDIFNEMSDLVSNDIWDTSSLNGTYWNKIRFLANEILEKYNNFD